MRGDISCDMHDDCWAEVTMIDDKGWIYCTTHGVSRRPQRKCRKLRPHELRRLRRGGKISRY